MITSVRKRHSWKVPGWKVLSWKVRALACAAALFAGGTICPAAAQTTPSAPATPPASGCAGMSPEMTFTAFTSNLGQRFGEGSRQYIFADGYICPDTDQKFLQFLTKNPAKAPNTIVVLNSGGGDLEIGMRLGEIIRQQKMWTQVGSQLPLMIPQNQNIPPAAVSFLGEPPSPPFPGACVSACTFTFMGGIVRTIGYDSNYSVHQFEGGNETQSATEVTTASIVKYLNEMGISPNYLSYMVLKEGQNVTDLTVQQLRDLNIITPHWQSSWQISPRGDNSGFDLKGIMTDAWGTHEIDIACAPKKNAAPSGAPAPGGGSAAPGGSAQGGGAPRPGAGSAPPPAQNQPALAAKFFLDPGPRGTAQALANAVTTIYLQTNNPGFMWSPLSLPAKPGDIKVVANRLETGLVFPESLIDGSPQIGIAFLFDPGAKLPMRLLKFESDLNGPLLKQFAATCQ
jgi:hypothetical protein